MALSEAGGKALLQKIGAAVAGSSSGGGDGAREKKARAAPAVELPSAGEKFRVVAPGGVVVREKVLPTSAHAGDLRKGETVTVLEAKVNEEVPGFPVVRIRIDVRVPLRAPVAGWVALSEAGGKALLQKIGAAAAGSSSSGNAESKPKENKPAAPAPEIPSAGEVFRVVAASGAVVRKGFLGTTSQCGSLQRGESVAVLEAKLSEEIPGYAVVRIRIDVRVPLRPHVAGWVSLAEPGGKEILRQVGAAAPEPESAASKQQKEPAKPEAVPDLPAVGSKLKVVAPVVAARKTSLGTSSQSGNLQRGEILTHKHSPPPLPCAAHVNCQYTFRTAIGKRSTTLSLHACECRRDRGSAGGDAERGSTWTPPDRQGADRRQSPAATTGCRLGASDGYRRQGPDAADWPAAARTGTGCGITRGGSHRQQRG